MYSNRESVNILTALLVKHGIRHAVVCPGSRNAPIVHNLNECPDIKCYPVTDERSAGFYAIGMMQALNAPVVVCVTSGTALLNLAPAVAEAYYQHLPLVVISADRPAPWIDQLDGQTLPQPDALGRFVRRAVTLPEADTWYCNRLVNEALLDATADDARPVQINVPITEPLFTFDVPRLPEVRTVIRTSPTPDYNCLHNDFVEGLIQAKRPMIVFGQTSPYDFEGNNAGFLFSHVIVLHEALSAFPSVSHFDEVLYGGGIETPDFIIHVGETVVSKRLRHYLRDAKNAVTWRISRSGAVEDTFQNLHGIIVGDAESVLQSLSHKIAHRQLSGLDYRRQWLAALTKASAHAAAYVPAYSQMAAVKYFESKLPLHQVVAGGEAVHYANSTAIRLANIFAAHHVWCNRGVNGIEGSLSTAAGFSCVTKEKVFCVIGDLSFFYDQNALWNSNLKGNLRILLLNNGKGGIFNMLKGLEQSPARDRFVAAQHQTSAEGICQQNDVVYLKATNMEQMQQGIDTLLYIEADRPVLLEVFTDADEDVRVFKDYYRKLSI
jgi:2-succinyl-5-enolpyruvyl-6-hydroxy-3-cyclohexene-1-carboxylate synthase